MAATAPRHRVGTALLSFQPVEPEECSDTVRGGLLNWQEASLWQVPFLLPCRTSGLLPDIPWPDVQARAGQNYGFFSWKCSGRGYGAEQEFLQLARERKWRPKNVQDAQIYNYRHHVDVMAVLPGGGECWVDVKSMRALRRNWPQQSEFMFVELHEGGWLLGGLADVIAQQVGPRQFMLLHRETLAVYVMRTVRLQAPVVPWPEQSLHRVYIRRGATPRAPTSVLSLISTREAFEAAGCGLWEASV